MRTAVLALLASLSFVASIPEAKACGGCFVPQPAAGSLDASQSGTVVTDHRIALAITEQGTTLWDQLQYVGDPAEFVWVLPLQGEAVVSVGSDEFMTELDDLTAPRILAPVVYCNTPPGSSGSSSSGCACGSSASDSAPTSLSGGKSVDAGGDDVEVTHHDVVGPYDTVQIRGDSSDSILTWLRSNGFDVPKDVEPTVQKYVDEKFGFLAVRLKPGASVRAMKPIRVSWTGKMPSLPLRMVAAGVASHVGLKLFVIGDGRWVPQNYPSFVIQTSELSWDFGAEHSNYSLLRDQKAAAADNAAWALEASIDAYPTKLASVPDPQLGDAGAGEGGADGGALPDIPPQTNDLQVAFPGGLSRRVTRLRADLPVRHLDRDLQLAADADQSVKSEQYPVSAYTNGDKLCPNGIAYSQPVTVPQYTSIERANRGQVPANVTGAACAVEPSRTSLRNAIAGVVGAALLGLAMRRKRG